MKLNIYKSYVTYLKNIVPLVFFFFISCEKALDPGIPSSQLTGASVFEDIATVKAALAGIYAELRENSPVSGSTSSTSVQLGLYTDELDYYSPTAQTDAAFFNHTVLPLNTAVSYFWNTSYELIYKANAIIEGIENSSLLQEEKEPLLGEAYFLRAYLHMYLSQIYGAIPYVTTTNYSVNAHLPRLSVTVISQKIEQDLLDAQQLLPIVTNGLRTIPIKGVATALLARHYLYNEQWQKALVESTAILEGGVFKWQTDLNDVFLKESPSILWQIKPEFEGAGTKIAETFIFNSGPPPLYALTEGFITSFETGDLRKEKWVREVSNGTTSWYHPYKYKQKNPEASSSEYYILFRLAEVYLMRAEANLHLGNLQQSQEDINRIRNRAGLSNTTAMTKEALKKELLQQRRFELFSEQGHRWFDLKRLNRAEEVLRPIKPGWKNTDVLLPIPQQELILNPNLQPQNPGY